jgi:acyl-CoA synthetase (AMP-forming)/AMP-acid ligase II
METIADRGITVMPGSPNMWMALAQMDHATPHGFVGVRLALSGAAKLPEQISHSMSARFGLQIQEGYGLTEAAPVVTTSIGMTWTPGSIGRPVPGIELRIVDENGDDVLLGDSGEIWIRGENIFAGYLNDPEATARVLTRDGWLRTGDVATMDADGRVRLVDRTKDLIKSGGEWISSVDVENELMAHPKIKEAAVVGVPHPRWSERPLACIVVEPGQSLTKEEVVEFLVPRLAKWQLPDDVVFIDEVPKTSVGKFSKKTLRDRFATYVLPTI